MSKGLGSRQRDILAKLAQHRDNPPDYNGLWHPTGKWVRSGNMLDFVPDGGRKYEANPKHWHDRYPEWMTVRELAGIKPNDLACHRSSDVEATRRAVRNLEAAGLVQTRMIYRNERGQRQIGVRLAEPKPRPSQ